MRENRKSQGMSIELIVVAALLLIVLVVLATILTNRFGIFSRSLESCAAKQGQCRLKCESNEATVSNTNCPEGDREISKKSCCVTVFKS